MVRDRQHHAHKCRIEREREREREKKRQRKRHMLTHYMLRARGLLQERTTHKS